MQSNGPVFFPAVIPAAIMLIFMGGMLALYLFVWGTIFKKAGYSFWFSLLMLVPIGNLVWLLVFTFSKWPVQQELEAYRAQNQGYVPNAFPMTPASPTQS